MLGRIFHLLPFFLRLLTIVPYFFFYVRKSYLVSFHNKLLVMTFVCTHFASLSQKAVLSCKLNNLFYPPKHKNKLHWAHNINILANIILLSTEIRHRTHIKTNSLTRKFIKNHRMVVTSWLKYTIHPPPSQNI